MAGIDQGLIALGGIGQGLMQGVSSYNDARRINLDQDKQRQANKLANAGLLLKAQENGRMFNPDTGEITNDADADARAIKLNRGLLNTIKPGIGDKAITDDMHASDMKESMLPKLFEYESAKAKADAMGNNTISRQDRQAHAQTLKRLSSNTQMTQRLNQVQNLDNALALITDSDKVTPEQIMEFQQAVRSNLGIKGTSGVDERSGTYLNSLGLKAASWNEFLSGDPAKIAQDNKILLHLKNLANVERRNAKAQYEKGISRLTAGNASVYARNPELRDDLDQAIAAYKDQLTSPNTGGAGLVPAGPTGLTPEVRAKLMEQLHAKGAFNAPQ